MNNWDYPMGSDTADAPWNQEDAPPVQCVFCHADSETLEVGDTCEDCGEENAMQANYIICDWHGYSPRGCPCDEY
jgi:hypothetical protein